MDPDFCIRLLAVDIVNHDAKRLLGKNYWLSPIDYAPLGDTLVVGNHKVILISRESIDRIPFNQELKVGSGEAHFLYWLCNQTMPWIIHDRIRVHN